MQTPPQNDASARFDAWYAAHNLLIDAQASNRGNSVYSNTHPNQWGLPQEAPITCACLLRTLGNTRKQHEQENVQEEEERCM